jgi:hypothetical protein
VSICGQAKHIQAMREAIVEKLKVVATCKDFTERDAVYFFVESYKVLEQGNRLHDYPVIRFYRNWICHSSLTKDADRIFEEVYVLVRAEKYMSFPTPEEDEPPGFHELLDKVYRREFAKYFFPKLRDELVKFGEQYLDKKTPNWQLLRKQLYNILVDIPLVVRRNDEEIFRLELRQLSGYAQFDYLEIAIRFPQGSQTTATTDAYFLYGSETSDHGSNPDLDLLERE